MQLLPEGGGGGGEEFMFERCFSPNASPTSLFEAVGAPLLEQIRKHRHAAVLLYGARGSGKERAFAGALVDDDDGHALDATDEAVGGEGLALSLGQAMTGAAGSHDAFEWTSRRRSSVLLAAAQDNDAATSLRVTLVEL